MRCGLTLLSLALLGVVTAQTQAAVIFHDGFDYPLGTAVNGQGNWGGTPDWSGNLASNVAAGSTYPGLSVTGGAASIYEGGIGHDITVPTDFYLSVLVNKTTSDGRMGILIRQGWPLTGIASFGITGSTLFAGDGSPVTPNIASGSDISTGSTTLLVAHFNDVAQTLTVWDAANVTNTVSYSFSNGTAPGMIEYFAYYGATGNVDEITIGDTLADVVPAPEPASLSLLAVGSLLALRRRARA